MKKRILILIISGAALFSTGCGSESEPIQVNVSASEKLQSNKLGTFKDIGDNLVYDSATGIVYIENITYGGCRLVYTPYYAPNGLPYRYNPKKKTFEEITE